jgi:hypothetical protein
LNDFKILPFLSINVHDNRIVSVSLLKTDNCFVFEVCAVSYDVFHQTDDHFPRMSQYIKP